MNSLCLSGDYGLKIEANCKSGSSRYVYSQLSLSNYNKSNQKLATVMQSDISYFNKAIKCVGVSLVLRSR